MIAAFLLLLVQDVPAPRVADDADIVVRATYGLTTMLFDKGSDGKLRNCRIMVSSGSQRRDTSACQATPVCFEATRDTVTDCVPFVATEPRALPGAKSDNAPAIYEIPRLVEPVTVAEMGPIAAIEESRETAKQRVKLPPLPQAPTGSPVIRITNAADQ